MSAQNRSGERGIALIMVLLVITLMMIIVLEFTYTVQVESHISRNALNSLQATYLARSGINILAGALIQDEDRNIDPGEKDKWRYFALGPCQNILENETWVPPNWQLCGRIVDESGKVNVNFSRPNPPNPNATQQDHDCKPNTPASSPFCWRDIIAKIAGGKGLDEEALKQAIDDYWFTAVAPAKVGQPAQLVAPEFGSLEDVAASFPLLQDRTLFDGLRNYVTAQPVSNAKGKRQLNVNTVPATVLHAILSVTGNDESLVPDIIAHRKEAPYKNAGEAFEGMTGNKAGLLQLFGTQSDTFRIEASAVVNGVGKTIRALVLRQPGTPLPGQPPDQPSWHLIYLDWAKESGISAARDAQRDNPEGLEGESNSDKGQI